jgi:hypothetical protein
LSSSSGEEGEVRAEVEVAADADAKVMPTLTPRRVLDCFLPQSRCVVTHFISFPRRTDPVLNCKLGAWGPFFVRRRCQEAVLDEVGQGVLGGEEVPVVIQTQWHGVGTVADVEASMQFDWHLEDMALAKDKDEVTVVIEVEAVVVG